MTSQNPKVQLLRSEKPAMQDIQKIHYQAQTPLKSTSGYYMERKEIIMTELLQSLLRCIATSVKIKNSFARLQFQNSNSYFGWLDSSGFRGFGTYTFAVGTSLKGTFEGNSPKGLGSLAYVNGDVYEGEFLAGCQHGYGHYKSKRFQYNGCFENGKFHGKGVLKTRTEEIEGIFHCGKIKQGEIRDCSGFFNGTFDESGSKKSGKFVFKNGNTYNGFWFDNKFDGFGEYNWITEDQIAFKSETKYIGYWKNGERHGLGMLIFNERRVICLWLKGKKSGAGIIIAANGTCYSGRDLFSDNQYIQSQCIRNCEESRSILSKATNILNMDAKNENIDDQIKTFVNMVHKLVDQYSIYCSPINPIRFPDYELPVGFFGSFSECKYLQQVLVENYTVFKKLYKKYTHVHNERMNYLGLNLFYMDVFHGVQDINIAECLKAGFLTVTDSQIYFDKTNHKNLLDAVTFFEFFQHFVHISKVLMDNDDLKSKAKELRPTFFGDLAMGSLLLLKMLEYKDLQLFQVREGIRDNPLNIVKLLKILEEMFMNEMSSRTAFKFLKMKNVIDKRCTELRETIENLYGVTKASLVLYDETYKLSNLEVIEIIFRTTQRKIIQNATPMFGPTFK
ncbi:uncharacterized protein LOC129920985 [Episyrphus balteatus]|uniref:uncharacterized protein LOC129920985 n=1 Tax=Episyrphus balteatus TaxID=286459 RepID=UPI0024862E68|nr:uncharacterized protein LOC129920985 [Episyrphus balteatus]